MEQLPALEEFLSAFNIGLALAVGAVFGIASGDNKLMAFARYSVLVFALAPVVRTFLT